MDGRRTAGGRSSAARVSSAAPKKKSFDRGGPVWPPRSNAPAGRERSETKKTKNKKDLVEKGDFAYGEQSQEQLMQVPNS